MRHRRKTVKLQRNSAQRKALLSGLACSLIEQGRIRTTLAKAKALKPIADKMVTLGKTKTVHARRQAFAFLHHKDRVKKLFDEIAPAAASRQGGYTRVVKLGARASDSAPMAVIEWVDLAQQSIAEEQTEEKAKS